MAKFVTRTIKANEYSVDMFDKANKVFHEGMVAKLPDGLTEKQIAKALKEFAASYGCKLVDFEKVVNPSETFYVMPMAFFMENAVAFKSRVALAQYLKEHGELPASPVSEGAVELK